MQSLNFHESTVTDLQVSGNNFLLKLEGVSYCGKKIKIDIEIKTLSKIFIDSEPSDGIIMLADDGEVLSLELNKSRLVALIEWNDFLKGESVTHCYEVEGDKLNISVDV